MHKPEILAPIQDFTSLTVAIQAGADAVFFGIRGFNMRVSAKNFTVEDLSQIMEVAHGAGIKAYLALNTIIYEEEIDGMKEVLRAAHNAGVDAVICWDLAVVKYARAIGLAVHLSTQASVANSEAALFYKNLGVTRIVLARECNLEQIKTIRERADIEIETFIHGAMCISISGRCFLSQFSTCHSANRGECRQPCRRRYMIKDVEGEHEYEIGPNYVLSPKDMCTLPFIEQLVFSGIDCFKIEGRNKSPEYVHDVTRVYREAVDFVWDNKHRREDADFHTELVALKERLMPVLERVFNRGFSSGFYLGKPLNEWSGASDSVATETKSHVGRVVNYYKKNGVAEILQEAPIGLAIGDDMLVQGPTTGNVRTTIVSMEVDHVPVAHTVQGQSVAIAVDTPVRVHDKVYRVCASDGEGGVVARHGGDM